MVRGSALSNMMHQNAEPKFALSELDVFKDLNAEEYRLVETIVNPLIFEKREVIIREGDQAKLFFVARGRVSVQVRIPTQTGEKRRRVASIGPGLTFGEMALFGGGARSADVVADQKLICYGFAVEQLKELAAVHPNIMMTILSNLTCDFSERLRHPKEAIRSLERLLREMVFNVALCGRLVTLGEYRDVALGVAIGPVRGHIDPACRHNGGGAGTGGSGAGKCLEAAVNPVTGSAYCVNPRGAPVDPPPRESLNRPCKPRAHDD